MVITSIVLSTRRPFFLLNENQILYLFSAASQVIAAVYGLIITGYIFLRNSLDRKAEHDDTFEEIVTLLKKDYFQSIITISIVTFFSISLCFLVIADATSKNDTILFTFVDIAVSTILIELILIISFVIRILNPNSLEWASNELRKEVSKVEKEDKGSLEAFLKHYNFIENILEKYGTNFMDSELNQYYQSRKKRISNSKLVYILFNEGKIDLVLKDKLIKLISFRNSLIHGSNLSISSNDVDFCTEVRKDLQLMLKINLDGEGNPLEENE
jgi:uncharacterized protein YutE (UPF0331/DUF86 family)